MYLSVSQGDAELPGLREPGRLAAGIHLGADVTLAPSPAVRTSPAGGTAPFTSCHLMSFHLHLCRLCLFLFIYPHHVSLHVPVQLYMHVQLEVTVHFSAQSKCLSYANVNLPLVYADLLLHPQSLRNVSDDEVTTGSFQSLKPRLIGLLMGSLQTETDSTNTQMLLGWVVVHFYWLNDFCPRLPMFLQRPS